MDKYAESVTICKQDGQSIRTMAMVQKEKIYVEDVNVSLCAGDVIERVLPSGFKERFIVVNATCRLGNPQLSHWEIGYEKEGDVRCLNQSINITGGINANKLYIQSIDDSTNITSQIDNNVFEELRKVIEEKIENNGFILEALYDLKKNVNKSTALDKFHNFVHIAADYMTLIAPFLPTIEGIM